MSRVKIEVIDTGNIGIYADFGSESEYEHEYDRQTIEKEDEEIRDFVKFKVSSYAFTRWWGWRNILEESNW